MLLTVMAPEGEKRGGVGDVLEQRRQAVGVCGSYTSDLGCQRSLRLDRVIKGHRSQAWSFGTRLNNGPGRPSNAARRV
jgi:hypothetical protein